jgi:Tol biopolymer transport system component
LGYPDYGEGTVSWTDGSIATITGEWIKSDAEASYGHSGGMMLNEQGELIGVLTKIERVGMQGQLTLARPINQATDLIRRGRAALQPLPTEEAWPPEPTGEYMVVVVAPALSLRARPDLGGTLLAEMPRGTVVEVLGRPEWDGERLWYPVRDDDSGQDGWASEVYLASWQTARTPILFTSDRNGSLDLYSIYADGTGLTQLTNAPGDESDASWSPDRRWIVFAYGHDGDSDLYYMNADGSDWVQLTSGPYNDVHPVWAPDGSRVAFVSDRDGEWEIYTLDEEGQIQRITFNTAWDSFPSWSPTARRLVYTSQRTGNYDLFMLNLETGKETQLTTNLYSDAHPAWSPLGDEIVYTLVIADGSKLRREIAVMSVYYPENPWLVTQGPARDALHRYPDWSPDGRWLVFESERDGNAEIYIMPARGGEMHNLTRAAGSAESGPVWGR